MCNFNAVELLQKRRAAASDMSLHIKHRMATIEQIDEDRWEHAETGCTCWQDAIASNPSEFSLLAEYQATKEQV